MSDAPDARCDEATPLCRRQSWGVITASLPAEELLKIDTIQLGESEALLRAVRSAFYSGCMQDKNNLRDRISTILLEEFADIDVYIAELISIRAKLHISRVTYTEEEMLYFLMKGLPDDYSHAKNTILMATPSPTWKVVVGLLKNLARSPNIAGSTSKLKKSSGQQAFATTTANARNGLGYKPPHTGAPPPPSDEVCRDNLKGRCSRSNCRFKHIIPPSFVGTPPSGQMCSYCWRGRHPVEKCFKKKADAKNKSQQVNVTQHQQQQQQQQQQQPQQLQQQQQQPPAPVVDNYAQEDFSISGEYIFTHDVVPAVSDPLFELHSRRSEVTELPQQEQAPPDPPIHGLPFRDPQFMPDVVFESNLLHSAREQMLLPPPPLPAARDQWVHDLLPSSLEPTPTSSMMTRTLTSSMKMLKMPTSTMSLAP